MPTDKLFEKLFNDKKSGKEVFPKISKARVSKAVRDREERKWEGYIYPSGLTWNMCVAKHIYDHLSQGGYTETDPKKLERMAIGTSRHEEWQEVLLDEHKIEKQNTKLKPFLMEPNYPQFVLDEMERKRKLGRTVREFPETYINCPHWFISGYLDLPYQIRNKKKIADFKTKNYESAEDYEKERAEFPLPKDLCQLYIYLVVTEKYEYWGPGEKIDALRLCYYCNQAFDHPKVDPEFEHEEERDEEKIKKTIMLLDEGRNQMLRFKAGEPKECNYELCSSCGKGSES
jgi:hypothetical protein